MEIINTDKTRQRDLEQIAEFRKTNPDAQRVLERAYRASRDHNITEMRKHLINAHQTRDVNQANKIEQAIRDYEYKRYGPSK